MRNVNEEGEAAKRKSLKRELKETLIIAFLGGSGLLMFFKGLSLFRNLCGSRPGGLILVIAGCSLLVALAVCHFLFDYAPQMGYRKGIIAYAMVLTVSVASSFFIVRILSR